MEYKGTAPDAPPPYPGRPGEYPPQPQGFQPPPVHAVPINVTQYPNQYPPTGGYSQIPVTGRAYGVGQPQVTVVVPHVPYGSTPASITCPHCGAQVVTTTKTQAGLLTYLLCGMCVLLGCWAGCCLIPFCIPECQDVEHSCPNCKIFLGMNRRL